MQRALEQFKQDIFERLGRLFGHVRTKYPVALPEETANVVSLVEREGPDGPVTGIRCSKVTIPARDEILDIVFWPDKEHTRRALQNPATRLIGQVLAAPAILESTYATPDEGQMRTYFGKLLGLNAYQPAELAALVPRPPGTDDRDPVMFCSWIACAEMTETLLRTMGAEAIETLGAGFWRAPGPMNLWVARDLPEVRETLLLRLFGAGDTLRKALRELGTLSRNAWELELCAPLVRELRAVAARDEDAMQYMAELDALHDRWCE